MLLAYKQVLSKLRIVLGSASPRRRELLEQCGLSGVEIVPSGFPEDLDPRSFPSPADYALENARRKVLDVWTVQLPNKQQQQKKKKESGPSTPVDLVVGSDTVVVLEGAVLEKPRSQEHAHTMLASLSGRRHSVVTAVALATRTSTGCQVESFGLCSSASLSLLPSCA